MRRKVLCRWIGASSLVVGSLVVTFLLMQMPYQTTDVQIGDNIFTARIASTVAQQEKGLSGVTSLSDDEAMLFVHDTPQESRIWMKDMRISIDAVWLDEERRVVHIEEALRPSSYPQTYGSAVKTRYILEFAEGTVKRHGIKAGAKANFTIGMQKGTE